MVSGFAHAPLSKGAYAACRRGLTSTALIAGSALMALVVAQLDAKPYFRFQLVPHILVYHQLWQALTYHVAFTSTGSVLLSVVVLYHASCPLERILGSRAYAPFLALVCLLHSALSLAWALAVHSLCAASPRLARALPQALQDGYLPAGPYGVLAALTLTYFRLIPPLWTIRVSELELTDRILVGVPMCLLAIAEPPYSCLAFALGLLAALLEHTLTRKKRPQLPLSTYTSLARVFGPLVGASRLPMRSSSAEYHRQCLASTMLSVPNVPARLRPWLWAQGVGSDAYVPAHVRYLMIFSPPLAQHRDAEDPRRLTEQLLFHTGEESAVSQAQMVRQVALASALVEFGRAAPAGTSASVDEAQRRRLSAASTSRRLLLVEVEPEVWLHACIAVPQYMGRGSKPEHVHWLVDAAAEQQLLDAWAQWRLRYGDPGVLLQCNGRAALERTLEHFFSRWVRQWDVEHQHVSLLRASAPRPPPLGVVAETMPALPSAPEQAQLDPPVRWFSEANVGRNPKPVVWLLLRDDEVIFPAMHSEAAETSALDVQDRRRIAMLVLEHVRGLEVARVQEETARPPVRRPPKSHAPAMSPGRLAASAAISAPPSPTLSVVDGESQGPVAWFGVDRMWSQVTSLGGQVASSVPSLPRLRRSRKELAAGSNGNGPAIQVDQQETVESEPSGKATDGQGVAEAGVAHPEQEFQASEQPPPSAEQVHPPTETGDKGGKERLFTTSAPFQALHDRLVQALQVDDGTEVGGAKADEPARSSEKGAAGNLPAQPAPDPSTKPAVQQDVSHAHPPSAPHATDEGATDARATTGSIPVHPGTDAPQAARSFPSLFAAPSQWYAWMRQDNTENGTEAQERATPPPPTEPHDPLLDGWGHEDPTPWQHEQVHVGSSLTGGLLDQRPAMRPLHVTHTTRGLLTAVFVWEQGADAAAQEAYLPLVWELLRRVQRVLNDAQRRRDEECGPEAPLRFLHTQKSTALAADRLGTADMDAGAEAPVAPGVEAQLVAAQQLMQRHGVAETLAREEQGRFWVATRAGAADGPSTDPTFLVLAGPQQRRVGVAECDHQLRRLAAQHPEFAL